jgi:Flp pilus assembly pilin Flp
VEVAVVAVVAVVLGAAGAGVSAGVGFVWSSSGCARAAPDNAKMSDA